MEDIIQHPGQRLLYPQLSRTSDEIRAEFDLIPADRKVKLRQLAAFVSHRASSGTTARLVFICTHNSRRSHLAQIWAQTAAIVYGIPDLETYSGGTETTAFNPRAVAALRRAGFRIGSQGPADNPRYLLRLSDELEPMECFSKTYDHPRNPATEFCAVMTCSAADETCPVVTGAESRIALCYDDPKKYDGTIAETEKYDERSRQIAREMFFALCLAAD